ncbi:bifunctional 4-hydroxy-2-oxoglutarate aldolase/2-dehydro-3-deoxy-phosphogluconate aldolase [Porticoccus sp. W117]|uniref:bifunctional 4-hydroxy-2-oxoglutarate aldolase/2-dehydro-3-deoxy-phosphogluconate aldolase n=1 Tax=Porticoccus sp. W117 TaxID=3054777 RepID=UPI002597700B|nr:bifunctional 4-hydroxy-2-oxoglutarate aldolase/2-dehydro-3-deoxy-phosphogluconate aldolase [Porticoccus sp. W117]MDM3870043.1 bifunctional 4-hydroxy-2-oxoglutarate aldolase/2-dehydro-3-deoxy-phosphogluconate aldolase [Porticoccus sp. W117]
MTLVKKLADIKVLPVLVIEDDGLAVDLCRALHNGGIKAVEITLRTPAAAAAIARVKQALPELSVSAGTVLNGDHALLAADAGVDFLVSPGIVESLVKKAEALSLPLLPGVATASEVMRGTEMGLNCFKLFPAVAVGGMDLLKSLASPLPNVSFCPTGGLSLDNFTDFLALPNVVCVGGSWMANSSVIADRDWQRIEDIARDTVARVVQ